MARHPKLRALGVYEVDTGAILSGVRLELSKGERAPNPFGRRWIKMASDAWLKLAKARLSASTSRVLFVLLYMVRDGNRIEVKQDALAQDAGMHQPDVAASIRELIQAGIIMRGKRKSTYVLNPRIGFIGGVDEHKEAILQWERAEQRERLGAKEMEMQPA